MANNDQDAFKNTSKAAGAFVRSATKFHDVVSADSTAMFPAESGRYRLYVSYACPWAHRTLLLRKLKGLEDVIALTVTDYTLPNLGKPGYKGWEFVDTKEEDSVFYEPHGFKFLLELYEHAHPGYEEEYKSQGNRPVVSVPVFFDEKTQKIVSNESAEIITFLNRAFNAFCKTEAQQKIDLNPTELQEKMQQVNAVVYPKINDGVYRCGFAKTQQAYEDAYNIHWEGMDEIETILEENRFLCGDSLTLSDIRLFPTLIRYDIVYYSHFKTSRNQVKEMPNLLRYLKEIYQMPGVKDTVNVEFIVKHYYHAQRGVNPTGIWPLGAIRPDVLKYLEE